VQDGQLQQPRRADMARITEPDHGIPGGEEIMLLKFKLASALILALTVLAFAGDAPGVTATEL
jgi:hypothetical protein